MRFSTSAIFAAVAIGAQALPQDVQPITQISDGQIQAPPATSAPAASYEVPSAPAPTEVLPSVTPVPLPSVVPSSAPAPVEPSSAYNTPVAPSVPAGTGASSAPYPISSGAVYTNGTVLPTGATSASVPAGESSTGSPQPTEGAGSGAATTYVSVGALFAGLFAFLA
ncbi:hypothetical protein PMIN06_003823 [Paraphaeosphaeria minitans]|uniref:Uncharacterized protein n=1 Tax=Paraphaeosphaeria minitans TaxID=565426 RepID=A0A9P6KS07_9PLEO|nr:hypothetical protein PMIN01_06109 [Paraphaeosphaeria minitans]